MTTTTATLCQDPYPTFEEGDEEFSTVVSKAHGYGFDIHEKLKMTTLERINVITDRTLAFKTINFQHHHLKLSKQIMANARTAWRKKHAPDEVRSFTKKSQTTTKKAPPPPIPIDDDDDLFNMTMLYLRQVKKVEDVQQQKARLKKEKDTIDALYTSISTKLEHYENVLRGMERLRLEVETPKEHQPGGGVDQGEYDDYEEYEEEIETDYKLTTEEMTALAQQQI